MRNHRPWSLTLPAVLLLLLPLPARAALNPEGAPLVIADESPCSFITHLEVTATPKGAFEVVWADDADSVVKGRRFLRNLQPTGGALPLLPLHGGLQFFELAGTWAGRYELALNGLDFGNHPGDPLVAYRMQLDLAGIPLEPPVRFKPPRFLKLAPAARGDSLRFRFEPPFFGPPSCQSRGLLASRIDADGNPLFDENRVTRRASPWGGGFLAVDRLPNDTFVAAYSTCQDFLGIVARRLNAAGAPIGKPTNVPLPGRVGNFEGVNLALAARGADFAVAAMVSTQSLATNGLYTGAVAGGRVFSPIRYPFPGSVLVDLEASPTGGYLLLFYSRLAIDNPERPTLFAQELDAQGVPQGAPLAITGPGEAGVNGAIANLPDGRWLVVTRAQRSNDTSCSERLIGTVLTSD